MSDERPGSLCRDPTGESPADAGNVNGVQGHGGHAFPGPEDVLVSPVRPSRGRPMGGLCAFLFSVSHDFAETVLAYLVLGPCNISDVLDWYAITPSKYRRYVLDIIHQSMDPLFPLPERLILVTLRDYDIEPNPDALGLLGELCLARQDGRVRGEWDRLARELYPSLQPRSGSILVAASAIAQYSITPTEIDGYCVYWPNGTTSTTLNGQVFPALSGSHPVIDALFGAMLPWARISSSKVQRAVADFDLHRGVLKGGQVLHLISRAPIWEAPEKGLNEPNLFRFDVLRMYLSAREGFCLWIQGLLSMACARSYYVESFPNERLPRFADRCQAGVRARLASWGYSVLERK
jgi:hypothetical protein